VVVASSSSVYGGARHGGRLRPSAEADRLQPRGGYARSKVALERRCWQRAAAGGLVAVARPFTVAGQGQRPDMAIARWLAAVRHGRPICILGGPDRTRDVTDVADVALGLVRMAEGGITGPVNLGTGVGHRLGDLAATVGAIDGHQPRLVIEPAGPAEPVATLADTRRCRRLLGFVPVTDLAALIARQAAAAPTPADDPDARGPARWAVAAGGQLNHSVAGGGPRRCAGPGGQHRRWTAWPDHGRGRPPRHPGQRGRRRRGGGA
jgi:nucleoside-diphosphate-sugar epimerase